MPLVPPPRRHHLHLDLVLEPVDGGTPPVRTVSDLLGRRVTVEVPGPDGAVEVVGAVVHTTTSVLTVDFGTTDSVVRQVIERSATVAVGWGDEEGWAAVPARFERWIDETVARMHTAWPPDHVERRAFHRVHVTIPAHVVRFGDGGTALATQTVDLGPGGAAVLWFDPPEPEPPAPPEQVGLVLHLPSGAVETVASVLGTRSHVVARLRIDQIRPADQDRIAAFLHQTDTHRHA